MQNAVYLGMKFKQKKKPLTREKILSLIKSELSNAKVLYVTKEELIEILLNERKEKFLSEFKRLNNQTINEKVEEISNFIKLIAQELDKKQAIIALQTGLSLLNKNRRNSIIEAKNLLKEDGIYGNKTRASLYETCKNYNSRVIKKYILKGLLSNIIFNTKNEQNIDTQKLLLNTKLSLERRYK